MVRNNGKINISGKDGNISLEIKGGVTPANVNKLIANFREVEKIIPLYKGLTLEQRLYNNAKSNKDPYEFLSGVLFDEVNNLIEKAKEYSLEKDEISTLSEDDYRASYFRDDKTYNKEDYLGLVALKYALVLLTMGAILSDYVSHPNHYAKFYKHDTLTNMDSFKRLERFLASHRKGDKPSSIIDTGELFGIVPMAEEYDDIIRTKATISLAYSKPKTMIKAIFSVIHKSRAPDISMGLKTHVDKDGGWASTFRQTSTLSLGEVGEINEYFSREDELFATFNLSSNDYDNFREGVRVAKVMSEDNGLLLHETSTLMVDSIIINIVPLSLKGYLTKNNMFNVIGVVYALAKQISDDLAYLVHTTIMESEVETEVDTNYSLPAVGMTVQIAKDDSSLFYGDSKTYIKELTKINKDYGYSYKLGYAISEYPAYRNDMLKFITKATVGLN